MNRRTWLWSTLMAVPLAVAGGFLYAGANEQGYACPLTGETLPCPDCCPLNCCDPDEQSAPQCCATGQEK